MAENKTQATPKSLASYLNGIEDPERKADCKTIAIIMEELTGSKHGKGFLYIKKLSDIDLDVLRTLISTSIKRLKNHP